MREANQLATGGLKPDLNICLSLPVTEGLARAARRGQADRMERADDAFHARVAKAFRRFATPAWQRKHRETGPVVTVDARGSVAEVAERVRRVAAKKLPRLAG